MPRLARDARRRAVVTLAAWMTTASLATGPAMAQTSQASPNSVNPSALAVPREAPRWLGPSWRSLLAAPRPADSSLLAVPNLPQTSLNFDATGAVGVYIATGPASTSGNAFFKSLGTNGRSCATCHALDSGMGLSLANINRRFTLTSGHDPLFAPVDGATCPKNVPQSSTVGSLIGGYLGQGGANASPGAYATLLRRGLFRVALPVPAKAEFTITVVSDPYGCNTDSHYNQVTNADSSRQQIVSVYRRPLMSANLPFKVATAANTGLFQAIDPLTGQALSRDANGQLLNGNIMWDGREATLASQVADATLTHAQAVKAPTQAQIDQIVAFENSLYAAQYSDNLAGNLWTSGLGGGPKALAGLPTGTLSFTGPVMTLFDGFNPAQRPQTPIAASIYRGEQIFNTRSFTISNVPGFNDVSFVGNNVKGTCSTCHGQVNVGLDPLPFAQRDIGIGGSQAQFGGPKPATDLPIFRLTCAPGAKASYDGADVLTNDPGRALITGKCEDIGRITVGSLRALAARPPYFSDGSAATLQSLVDIYKARFGFALTAQDEADLVNFLASM